LKKKNKGNKKLIGEHTFEDEGLSTIGEALRVLNPDMAMRFKALQGVESPVERVMEVIFDLFPYAWKDTELLGEGLLNIFACEFEEAVEALKGTLQMNPDAYPAYHLLGHVYGCLKDYKEEIECYRKALKLRSDYPHIHYSLGVAYWLSGREKKAMAAFHTAVPMAPEFSVPEFWLTFTFARLKRYPSQNNGTGDKNSIEKSRIFAQAFYMIGLEFIEHGHNSEARLAFKGAVEHCPDFAEAYYQLGVVHVRKLRNTKRAKKYLETAEHLFQQQNELQRAMLSRQLYLSKEDASDDGEAAENWLKEGLRLQQSGMNQGAVDAYKVAIAFKRDFLDAYYNMGIAYGSLEESGVKVLDHALGAFKQSVRLNPKFIHGYVALAAAYVRKGEYEEALEVLSRAVLVDQNESNVHYYMGVAYRAIRDVEKAVNSLQQAVLLKPDSVQMQFSYGLTLTDCGRYEEACDAFQEAVRVKPDFAEGHYMLGHVYLDKLSESEQAIHHLKKAEKLFIKLEDFERLARVRRVLAKLQG
jgi:tetratricopeptide (TPR) repeat protein|tara:strand:- start:9107 stop:10687 length:1581 start_codon:yes stop_codon:yes gene_type:complete